MSRVSTIQWIRDMVAPGSNPSSGVYLYGEAGQIKVRQADGVTFALAPSAVSGALVDGGSPSTVHTGNLRVDFGSVV